MDNKAWSQEDCYYADFIEDDYRFTCDYTIGEVLKEGQSFKYVFDFGYDWRFQCKVLKIEDKPCDEDRVVRSVGEAPEQYADCDDWE